MKGNRLSLPTSSNPNECWRSCSLGMRAVHRLLGTGFDKQPVEAAFGSVADFLSKVGHNHGILGLLDGHQPIIGHQGRNQHGLQQPDHQAQQAAILIMRQIVET